MFHHIKDKVILGDSLNLFHSHIKIISHHQQTTSGLNILFFQQACPENNFVEKLL